MSKSLRQRYYEQKVQALHNADPHSWRKLTKKFLSPTDSDSLDHLSVPHGETLVNVINSYFVSVMEDLPTIDLKLLDSLTDTELTADFVIEPYEVAEKLSKLNIYKAPRPDGLPTWLLQQCAPYVSEPLAAIYNASLKQGAFPALWKAAEIVPVPRKWPPRCIESDLRPIVLLPVVAKIFEALYVNGFWTCYHQPSILYSLVAQQLTPSHQYCTRSRSFHQGLADRSQQGLRPCEPQHTV